MVIALNKEIPVPDFLIIGAQKGGTTWLRRILKAHPDVYIPAYPEEVHFFNRSLRQPDLYLSLFNVVEGKEKLLGEKSPNYFHMPEKCIQFAHQIVPKAKLIVLLRNPVERAWSQARMNTLEAKQEKLSTIDWLKLILQVTHKGNYERTNYPKILKKWLSHFDKKQLLLYYYDDLQTDPKRLVDRVCTDLDLAHFEPAELQKRIHVSRRLRMPPTLHWFLTWRYKGMIHRLRTLGFDLPVAWRNEVESVSILKKAGVLAVFLPYYLVTTIVYQFHKFRLTRSIDVPKIIWTTSSS